MLLSILKYPLGQLPVEAQNSIGLTLLSSMPLAASWTDWSPMTQLAEDDVRGRFSRGSAGIC